jgi:DNA recombination protein RmuC
MVELTALLIVLVAGGGALAWFARLVRRELMALRADSTTELSQRTAEVDRRLDAMTKTMDRRLETTAHTTTEVQRQLGKLGQANAEILARANELKKLEQALRPPKARGGFGELLLGNLLRDRLPPDAYELQYGFSTGERVDAVIRVERLVPIDAKFPLEDFERLVEAQTEDEQALHHKAFARTLRTHVDSIAEKYIRPDEGTYDFALMYLPSEAVYYELVCGRTGALLQYAHSKRVFPVSPTTFTAQLQVIVLGLKGMQIEQRAHEVMAYVAQLEQDFGRFRDDFDLIGKHLSHAQSKYGEAERRLDRFEAKLERAAETDADPIPAAVELAELPRADAA